MVIKLFRENGIPVINVVRRQEQVDLLKNEHNAEHVLNSSDEDFDAKLQELTTKLGASMGIEACAGEMPGKILNVLPHRGVLLTYGGLSD